MFGRISALYDFSGRAGRTTYWLTSIVATMLFALSLGPAFTANTALSWSIFAAGVAFVLPVIFAVAVRRLHDRSRSGWWAPLFYIAPTLLGALAERSGGNKAVAGVLLFASVAILLWSIVELGFLRGRAEPMNFGPGPKAQRSTLIS